MYILQSATNRNEEEKINGGFVERSIPPSTRGTGGRMLRNRAQGGRRRRNARDVFPLFLLSALVVDSTTIRGTSGKHRTPFNWANFLSSSEKTAALFSPLPSSPRPSPFTSRAILGSGWISERFPWIATRHCALRSILDSVQDPSHNSPPILPSPRESFTSWNLCSSLVLNYRMIRYDMQTSPKKSAYTRYMARWCMIAQSLKAILKKLFSFWKTTYITSLQTLLQNIKIFI